MARAEDQVTGVFTLSLDGFDAMLALLATDHDVVGPVVKDGAVVLGAVDGRASLPAGVGDDQGPGRYRLTERDDTELFSWAVGPESIKRVVLPAEQETWRTVWDPADIRFREPATPTRPIALLGVRPCDVAALGVLDHVLGQPPYEDPLYAQRRAGGVVIAVECTRPATTCFCASMGTGPAAT
ncbi:MAG: hypothetical protein ACRDV0_04270, partial [Acidimicrobiales bacterium]